MLYDRFGSTHSLDSSRLDGTSRRHLLGSLASCTINQSGFPVRQLERLHSVRIGESIFRSISRISRPDTDAGTKADSGVKPNEFAARSPACGTSGLPDHRGIDNGPTRTHSSVCPSRASRGSMAPSTAAEFSRKLHFFGLSRAFGFDRAKRRGEGRAERPGARRIRPVPQAVAPKSAIT